MREKILDTNKLITQWRRSRGRVTRENTPADAEAWAAELIGLFQTNKTLTPVYLEFVGGVAGRREMQLAKAFLAGFSILDGGDIRPEDWTKARKLAERITPGARPRGAIDCPIRAIAIRLRCELVTDDAGMPRQP